jgi:hypothetical protein
MYHLSIYPYIIYHTSHIYLNINSSIISIISICLSIHLSYLSVYPYIYHTSHIDLSVICISTITSNYSTCYDQTNAYPSIHPFIQSFRIISLVVYLHIITANCDYSQEPSPSYLVYLRLSYMATLSLVHLVRKSSFVYWRYWLYICAIDCDSWCDTDNHHDDVDDKIMIIAWLTEYCDRLW